MLKFMKTPRNTNYNRHLSKNKLHKKMHNNLQYRAVTNLSDKNISNSTLIALSKGLSYIPSPKPAPYKQIYNSFLKYRKNMYNRYFFRHNTNTNRHPFKLPTNFTAPIPDNSITFKNTFQIFTMTSKQNMRNTKNRQNQTYLKMNYKLSITLKLIMI
jgi:hypothetical protein